MVKKFKKQAITFQLVHKKDPNVEAENERIQAEDEKAMARLARADFEEYESEKYAKKNAGKIDLMTMAAVAEGLDPRKHNKHYRPNPVRGEDENEEQEETDGESHASESSSSTLSMYSSKKKSKASNYDEEFPSIEDSGDFEDDTTPTQSKSSSSSSTSSSKTDSTDPLYFLQVTSVKSKQKILNPGDVNELDSMLPKDFPRELLHPTNAKPKAKEKKPKAEAPAPKKPEEDIEIFAATQKKKDELIFKMKSGDFQAELAQKEQEAASQSSSSDSAVMPTEKEILDDDALFDDYDLDDKREERKNFYENVKKAITAGSIDEDKDIEEEFTSKNRKRMVVEKSFLKSFEANSDAATDSKEKVYEDFFDSFIGQAISDKIPSDEAFDPEDDLEDDDEEEDYEDDEEEEEEEDDEDDEEDYEDEEEEEDLAGSLNEKLSFNKLRASFFPGASQSSKNAPMDEVEDEEAEEEEEDDHKPQSKAQKKLEDDVERLLREEYNSDDDEEFSDVDPDLIVYDQDDEVEEVEDDFEDYDEDAEDDEHADEVPMEHFDDMETEGAMAAHIRRFQAAERSGLYTRKTKKALVDHRESKEFRQAVDEFLGSSQKTEELKPTPTVSRMGTVLPEELKELTKKRVDQMIEAQAVRDEEANNKHSQADSRLTTPKEFSMKNMMFMGSKKKDWDIESVASTRTEMYTNNPNVVCESELGRIKNEKARAARAELEAAKSAKENASTLQSFMSPFGLPIHMPTFDDQVEEGEEENSSDSDSESNSDDEEEESSKKNRGKARQIGETLEEKKARKAEAKQAQRDAKQRKKMLKTVYSKETLALTAKQMKQATNKGMRKL